MASAFLILLVLLNHGEEFVKSKFNFLHYRY